MVCSVRSPSQRVPAAGVLAVLVLIAGVTGCSDLESAAAAQSGARTTLAAELAAQLSDSADLTYTAEYRLSGGATATVAQTRRPARRAYAYPGGTVLSTAESTTSCRIPAARRARPVCTRSAPLPPAGVEPATVFAAATRAGMVPPGAVLSLLNTAALDTDVRSDRHDTTIAGHHATCVSFAEVAEPAPLAGFSACVTNEGVLGTFTGVVDGNPVDVVLTSYSTEVAESAFATPPNAKVTDRRKG